MLIVLPGPVLIRVFEPAVVLTEPNVLEALLPALTAGLLRVEELLLPGEVAVVGCVAVL